jgi:hypothetical protein
MTDREEDYQGPTCIWLFDSRARALTGKRTVHIVPDAKVALRIILDGEKTSIAERTGYEMYFHDSTSATLEEDTQTINDFWTIYGWSASTSDDDSTTGFAGDVVVVNHMIPPKASE